MKKLILITLSLLLVFTAISLAEEAVSPDLSKIKELFRKAKFDDVVLKATEMLESSKLNHNDSLQTIRLLAISLAQEEKADQAGQYILKLMAMDNCTDFEDSKVPRSFARIWYKVQKETGFEPCKKKEILTIAIIEFDNGSFTDPDEVKNVGIGIAAMLRHSLGASEAVYTPSREHINYLLDELKLSQSDLVDKNHMLQIGKVIGAKTYLFGTFYNMPKNKFRIDARIIDTETTLPVKQFSVEGKSKKMEELTSQLTKEILEYFNVKAENIKAAEAQIPNINLAALMKYSLAVVYEEAGEFENAKKAFAEVGKLAPDFSLASDGQQRVEVEIKSKGR